jgi:hypothetical protein
MDSVFDVQAMLWATPLVVFAGVILVCAVWGGDE